jgi:membrane protein involved in colicin uptake
MTAAAYRELSAADRQAVNEALDDWIDHLNSQNGSPADGSLTGQPPAREARELG